MTQKESSANKPAFGQDDTTYLAAGGEAGIVALVDSFYEIMSSTPGYRKIFDWHPDSDAARDKLARFLSGWMGGPKRYQEKYGAISIPRVHAHLAITSVERDMWLNCMRDALASQSYTPALRDYLLRELSVPANHVLRRCTAERQQSES